MGSLRFRLLIGSSLVSAGIVLVAGLILYSLIRHSLLREFDREMEAELRVLASQVDVDNSEARLDIDNPTATQFRAGEHPEFFELWGADGHVFQRSASLGQADLSVLTGQVDNVVLQDAVLSNGLPGREATLTFKPGGEEEKHHHERPTLAVTLGLAKDTTGVHRVLGQIAGLLALTGLAATLAIAGLLQLVVRRGLRPLTGLALEIRNIREQDLSVRIAQQYAPAELVPVIDGLNHLLARLDNAFRREKSLTADVAHELRTPLYGLRSKLEVTLSKNRDAPDYRRTLDDCLAITESMQSIIENLLTLARLDAGPIAQLKEPVDLEDFLAECWTPFTDRAAARNLHVKWRVDPIAVETDREKLAMVVRTLFDNAAAYTNIDGTLMIETQETSTTVQISISNTGSELGADDIAHVFDRFWRGDAARAVGLHCGLGLALAREMTQAMGAQITAQSDRGGWFSVRLTIPATSLITETVPS